MTRRPLDDRGHPCSLPRLSAGQVARRFWGIGHLTGDQATARERKATDWPEAMAVLVGGALGWTLWQAAIDPLLPAGVPVVVRILLIWCGCAAGAVLGWLALLGPIRARRFRRVTGTALAQGVCPACGYALAGLVPEPDGCLACPECHAAWRADRVGPGPGEPAAPPPP